jgi:CHASE2 domain-containing sensor protein/nitrogen-specific signal transduction histidine kinase
MKTLLGAVAASCFVAVAILLLSWTTYFAQLNLSAYDFALRLAGPVPIKSPTVIVAIDQDSLNRVGRWPWPRDRTARLIDRIESGRPRAIALDILLDEEDKTTAKGDKGDYELATAIANAHAIVLGAHLETKDGVERWDEPDALFLKMHVLLGHVHTDPDFDGINRRIPSLKVSASGKPIPALAVEALHAAKLPFKADFERKVGTAVVYKPEPEPINIRFVGDIGSFPRVPAWQLLDDSADTSKFKDQIALIGFTGEAEGDQWFTPFTEAGQKMRGVEIHANAIETLYAGRAIAEVSQSLLFAGLFAYILLLWWLDRRFEGPRFYLASLLTGPGALIISWLLMKYANLWLEFPPFWAALVVVVPGLEVSKIVRVNWDLDRKIERLSTSRLSALHLFEPEWPESGAAAQRRASVLNRRQRNARWKLDAVDFFNDELMRFLSFNNAILASIEDVIVVCDRSGRVVYQNPAAKRLAGYRENPGGAREYLGSVLDGRKFELEPGVLQFVPACDGRTFYNLTVTPISMAGVVLSLHDATALHELNQSKNEMVSLVSHELRTPLTSIRGYSEMLLKYNLVQDKGREFLGTIIDESNRLNQLIQSFLDIAYIESGRQKITKTDFEVGPVLKDLATVVAPVAGGKQITIVTPEANGMRVRADRLLLYQALTNLVTNAIKYSPAGTTVRIGVSNGNGAVCFQIEDQGCGIPAEEASKVFEKFYRRGNKETREQSGFGLGLAFVKEVAVRHGGDVIVESSGEGKGSTFKLSIPI